MLSVGKEVFSASTASAIAQMWSSSWSRFIRQSSLWMLDASHRGSWEATGEMIADTVVREVLFANTVSRQ